VVRLIGSSPARHTVKPGLTGTYEIVARVDGRVMHERRQRTDLHIAYAGTIGLVTDLKILLLTIPAVVRLKKGTDVQRPTNLPSRPRL
jgi:lipopolysaccharide/colanic/teichoic acid biosynthesis glycosyltransferase